MASRAAPGNNSSKYQGATVFEVERGMHYDVGVLDFKSMYPSILVCKNASPDTMLLDKDGRPIVDAAGNLAFVDKAVRRGCIPLIVQDLMAARECAKQAAESATDPMSRDIFNQRQIEIKVTTNSIYGLLGNPNTNMQLQCIAEYVTKMGREDIALVKQIALAIFTPENGYAG